MVGVGGGVLVGIGVGDSVIVGVDVGIGGDVLVGDGVGVEVTDGVSGISVVGSGVEVNKADSGDGVTLDVGWGTQDIRVNARKNTIAPILLFVMNTNFLRSSTVGCIELPLPPRSMVCKSPDSFPHSSTIPQMAYYCNVSHTRCRCSHTALHRGSSSICTSLKRL
jgi:hypothetical protein